MSKVYLVGAGPGDPDLITVKGRRILERADSILFDHLAPESLLDVARPDAERVYVGKKKSSQSYGFDPKTAEKIFSDYRTHRKSKKRKSLLDDLFG